MKGSALDGFASSGAGDAATPRDFFDRLDAEFRFTLDVAAAPGLSMLPRYFALEYGPGCVGLNALDQIWVGERWWCNPPYGRGIERWVEKALGETIAADGMRFVPPRLTLGVMLLPARTDTSWFRWLLDSPLVEVRYVRGRIAFGGWNPKGRPIPEGQGGFFPSVLAVFRPRDLLAPSGDPSRTSRRRREVRGREEKP